MTAVYHCSSTGRTGHGTASRSNAAPPLRRSAEERRRSPQITMLGGDPADRLDRADELVWSPRPTAPGRTPLPGQDVLLLFDASLDGIESPDWDHGEHRLFVNLHPRAWFLPFAVEGEPSAGA